MAVARTLNHTKGRMAVHTTGPGITHTGIRFLLYFPICLERLRTDPAFHWAPS